MKVSATSSRHSSSSRVVPAIPFERPESKELRKQDMVSFKIKTNPGDPNSPEHTINIAYFKDGSPEELLTFISKIRQVITGQGITAGPNQYALMRQVLQGDPLGAFDNAATAAGSETTGNFKTCCANLIKYIFPKRALTLQLRYMRRYMRKPQGVTTRAYKTRLEEMRMKLKYFPGYTDNVLTNDDVQDILEHAVPNSWRQEMTRQGFNPTEHTASEFVEFCERLEATEGNHHGTKSNNNPTGEDTDAKQRAKTSAGGKRKRGQNNHQNAQNNNNNNNNKIRTGKWCVYHQTDSHDTGECKVVLAQAKKMRATYEATSSESKNFAWNRKDNERKKKQKEELHAMMAEAMASVFEKNKKKKEESFAVNKFANLTLSDDDDE